MVLLLNFSNRYRFTKGVGPKIGITDRTVNLKPGLEGALAAYKGPQHGKC